MKRNSYLGLVCSLSLFGFACGDDGGGDGVVTPDAGEECTGHGCPDAAPGDPDAAVVPPAGGWTMVELIRRPDQSKFNRVTSYYFASQDPEHFPEPPVNTCIKLSDLEKNTNIAYLDLGPTLTLTPSEGGDDIVIGGLDDTKDFRGVLHDYVYLNPPTGPGMWDDLGLKANTYYDFSLEGTPNLDGYDITEAVHVPPNWDQMTPDQTMPFAMTKGQDFKLEWEAWQGPEKEGYNPYTGFSMTFVETFPGADPPMPPKGHTWCLPNAADGEFTIPKEIVDTLPATGFMTAGPTRHHVVPLREGLEGHIFGVNCKITPFTVE